MFALLYNLLGPADGAQAATLQPEPVVVSTTGQPLAFLVNSSTTPFQLYLPMGASCSGDTATGGYHVNSFVVDPIATQLPNPGAITYGSAGPNQGMPLFDQQGAPFGPESTAPSTGAIPEPTPTFSWTLVPFQPTPTSGSIYPGTFDVGISCATNAGAADNYWYVTVTFQANASDPNGFTWTTPLLSPLSGPPTSTSLSSSPNPSTPGQTVTYTATVTNATNPPSPAQPAEGTVTFYANTSEPPACRDLPLDTSGTATCTVPYSTAGAHSIVARFSGSAGSGTNNGAEASVSSAVTQTVSPPAVVPEGRPWLLGVSAVATLMMAAVVTRRRRRIA